MAVTILFLPERPQTSLACRSSVLGSQSAPIILLGELRFRATTRVYYIYIRILRIHVYVNHVPPSLPPQWASINRRPVEEGSRSAALRIMAISCPDWKFI